MISSPNKLLRALTADHKMVIVFCVLLCYYYLLITSKQHIQKYTKIIQIDTDIEIQRNHIIVSYFAFFLKIPKLQLYMNPSDTNSSACIHNQQINVTQKYMIIIIIIIITIIILSVLG